MSRTSSIFIVLALTCSLGASLLGSAAVAETDTTPPEPVEMGNLPPFVLEEPYYPDDATPGYRPFRVLFDVPWMASTDTESGVKDYLLWFQFSQFSETNFTPPFRLRLSKNQSLTAGTVLAME